MKILVTGARDYIYVEDVCRANVLALLKGDNDIFIIGSGKEIYTEDLYNISPKNNQLIYSSY